MVNSRLEYLPPPRTASDCGIVMENALIIGVTAAAVVGAGETVIVRLEVMTRYGDFGLFTRKDILRERTGLGIAYLA